MKSYHILLLLLAALTNCQPAQQELRVPVLNEITSLEAGKVTFTFSHAVQLEIIELDPRLTLTEHDDSSIKYAGGEPGVLYSVQAKAKNGLASLRFNAHFYDTNPSPAAVRLNEIAIIHDKTRSNAIELLVTAAGNLGGITLLVGHSPETAHHFVFPSKVVQQGQYIVVDVRALQGEFHFAEAPGIPNTRGIIALMHSPYGPINEVFVYERFDRAETLSTQKTQFDAWHAQLVDAELWIGAPFNSRYITATRSANRHNTSPPPHGASTWYTTVTRGLSLGKPNNPERFKPKN